MISCIRALDERIDGFERELARRAKEDQDARRLVTIPGVGPIIATATLALARRPRRSAAAATSPPGWG